MEMPVFAEEDDADLVGIDVEGNAEHLPREDHQFLKADVGEARDLGDAGGDTDDRPHLPQGQLRDEGFPRLAYCGQSTVENGMEALRFHLHWPLGSDLGSSGLGSDFSFS